MERLWGFIRMRSFVYSPAVLQNNAWDFDGSTTYLSKSSNLASIASSKVGFLSFFVRFPVTTGGVLFSPNYNVGGVSNLISIGNLVTGAKPITMALQNSSGNSWVFTSSATVTYNLWYHVMASWDTNYAAGSKVGYIYVNDTGGAVTTTSDLMSNSEVYWSGVNNWAIGSDANYTTLLPCCLGQFFFAPGQTLDITNSTNRRKFSNSSFHPIYTGRRGEVPTGTSPSIYLTSSTSNIGYNSGTGGNFTPNGTFADCSSTP